MAATFYPALGILLFWVGLIVAIILFASYKKLYLVFYTVSVALYVFTAGFFIDVFDVGKVGVLLTLIFSAVIFMVLGAYLAKELHHE